METAEYYGGLYPEPSEPHEVIDCEDEEDFDEWFSDIMHDEKMIEN